MPRKSCSILFVLFLSVSSAFAQSESKLQQASAQFRTAEAAESALNERSSGERTRSEYLKVIHAYERVYLITPHTGWADNALTSMARLYEAANDSKNAIKTLQFLIREYPQTPLKDIAEKDIARLSGVEAPPADGASVENIRFWEQDRSVRVVVDITGEVTFKSGEAKSPNRFFIDIAPARLSSMLVGKEWPVESKTFQKIRVAQYDGSRVRIVLDGASVKDVVSSTLKDPSRIILDITGNLGSPAVPAAIKTSSRTPATTSAIQPSATSTTPAAPASTAPIAAATTPAAIPATVPTASIRVSMPVLEPDSTPAGTPSTLANPTEGTGRITEAQLTNRGTSSFIRTMGLKISRVTIDAGHGGHDTGSIGPGGFTEKELVLDVARRLKDLIEAEMGADVVMTRSDDTFIPLESRTKIANKEESDLFISIHANSSQDKSVRGVETFFLNLNANSREALATASRENAASERSIHEQNDLMKKIMLNDKVDESRELADHIQGAMSKRSNAGPNRGVKPATFVVLVGANMPSILAEISFISNPDEEKRLKTPAYRQQIAESLLQGIRSYASTLSSTKTAKSQGKAN